MNKTAWVRILVPLGVILVLIAMMAIAATDSGIMSEVGAGGQPLALDDYSAVPPSVVNGANGLAEETFGNNQEKRDAFVEQLLAFYSRAEGKDFIIIFNPGGWGWSGLEDAPGWLSIVEGIDAELEGMGYSLVEVNYLRAEENFWGKMDEFWGFFTAYHTKARDLARRVDFLTTHLPDVRVILTGESMGTVTTGGAMGVLEGNPRVYSIQTGPPFWHDPENTSQTLVITDNGIAGDALSEGNYFEFVSGCYQKWFGVLEPTGDLGTEPHLVLAPGHDYWWQYPGIGPIITEFLVDRFGQE